MGQKVSPIGLRIGINKGWNANWYANKKDFGKYLQNDLAIRNYLDKIRPKFEEGGNHEKKTVCRNHDVNDRRCCMLADEQRRCAGR